MASSSFPDPSAGEDPARSIPGTFPRWRALGEAALTLELGDKLSPAVRAAVQAIDRALSGRLGVGPLTGVIEVVPTFRSLTVIFDPLLTSGDQVAKGVEAVMDRLEDGEVEPPRHWSLPVCYEPTLAPDLIETAQRLGISAAELVRAHCGQAYEVLMLGFLPGFPFLGELVPSLQLPRRATPRVRVPPGSVAVAGAMTAIYPWESPGGWHLIGNCPVPLFDARHSPPVLLQVGDRVTFRPISIDEFAQLETARQGGDLDGARFLDSAA